MRITIDKRGWAVDWCLELYLRDGAAHWALLLAHLFMNSRSRVWVAPVSLFRRSLSGGKSRRHPPPVAALPARCSRWAPGAKLIVHIAQLWADVRLCPRLNWVIRDRVVPATGRAMSVVLLKRKQLRSTSNSATRHSSSETGASKSCARTQPLRMDRFA